MNDDTALQTAKILLQRHDLLQKAKQGQTIDLSNFDRLTEKLKIQHINLYTSAELFDRDLAFVQPEAKNQAHSSAINAFNPNTQLNQFLEKDLEKNLSELEKGKSDPIIKPKEPESFEQIENKTHVDNASHKSFDLSDDNLVVLSVEYKNHILNNGLVSFGNSEKLYLPLAGISGTLDFKINVDTSNGTASGWFISEDRKFSLDLAKMQVVSDGRKMTIPTGGVEHLEDDFFVDTEPFFEMVSG